MADVPTTALYCIALLICTANHAIVFVLCAICNGMYNHGTQCVLTTLLNNSVMCSCMRWVAVSPLVTSCTYRPN